MMGGWRGAFREEAAQAWFPLYPEGTFSLLSVPGLGFLQVFAHQGGTIGGNLHCAVGQPSAMVFGAGTEDPCAFLSWTLSWAKLASMGVMGKPLWADPGKEVLIHGHLLEHGPCSMATELSLTLPGCLVLSSA